MWELFERNRTVLSQQCLGIRSGATLGILFTLLFLGQHQFESLEAQEQGEEQGQPAPAETEAPVVGQDTLNDTVNSRLADQLAQDRQRELIEKVAEEFGGGGRSSAITEGEILQIHVIEDQSFDQLYQVRPGGYIILPRVGRVRVAGMDLEGAEEAVRIGLEKAQQLIDATVLIERPASGYSDESSIIFLAGAFDKQGPRRVAAGVTQSLIGVLLGESTDPLADFSQVRVLRREEGKSVVMSVDVQAIFDGKKLRSDDVLIVPGDIIVLPMSPTVYVTGNVTTPGMLKIEDNEPLTAYTAILKSGGFARFANKKKVFVVRSLEDGKTEKIVVNIPKVQEGRATDVKLQARDIVVVPERFFSW